MLQNKHRQRVVAELVELLQAPRPVRERSECDYTACYCEENVYKLCADLLQHNSADCLFAVFISNPEKQVSCPTRGPALPCAWVRVRLWPHCKHQVSGAYLEANLAITLIAGASS